MNYTKKKAPPFRGVGTALITPFADGRVELATFRRLCERQIVGGADALIVCGTTGEAATLTAAERTLEALADGLGKLTAALDEREKNSYSADDLTTVMLAEIDMLYEIFNSAELPQYIKDRVGERIAEMKKTLEKRDKEDAES